MNDLEKELDQCNIWLYQILNKIADIKIDLLEKEIKRIKEKREI